MVAAVAIATQYTLLIREFKRGRADGHRYSFETKEGGGDEGS